MTETFTALDAVLVVLIAVIAVASGLAIAFCLYKLPTKRLRLAAKGAIAMALSSLIALAEMALMVAIAST